MHFCIPHDVGVFFTIDTSCIVAKLIAVPQCTELAIIFRCIFFNIRHIRSISNKIC